MAAADHPAVVVNSQNRPLLTRLPAIAILVLVLGPVLIGLAGTLLPASGYLPALGGTEFSLAPAMALFAQPGILTSILLSLGTGLAATALSFGLVVFFTAGWLETRAFRAVTRLLSPLLSVPHAAAAIGLAFLVAPSGLVMRALSPWATGYNRPPDLLILHDPLGITMTAGLVAKEVPFLFLMLLAALPQSDARRRMRIAANLGYGRVSGFLKTVLPDLYAQIRLPVMAVLAYSTSVVDVAEILGPTTPAPLAPRIIDWMSDPDPALRFQASAGAALQLLVSAFALLLWRLGEILCSQFAKRTYGSGQRRRADRISRMTSLSLMTLLISAMVFALVILILWSVTKSWWFPATLPNSLTFNYWLGLWDIGGDLITNTIMIAGPVALLSLVLVIWQLETWTRANNQSSTLLKFLIFLPLIVPQVSFLFGLQIFFLLAGSDGSLAAVALAHLVFVLPYVFLALSDPWRHLDPRYSKVAASLGASDRRIFFRIRLPLLLRPVLVALAIGFAVSIGQYLPTLMIGVGRIATVTTESVALASGGNRSVIAIYAMLQLILPLIGFLLAALIPAMMFRHRPTLSPNR